MSPKLFLVPCPIGKNAPIEMLPISIKKTIIDIDFFIVEHEKEARRFIKKICPNKDQSELKIYPLNKKISELDIINYLDPCKSGKNIGLISDAGCPCIADPGNKIVAYAHKKGISVKPLVGPSSIILSLMSSGFNGQNFIFRGYLPIKSAERFDLFKEIFLNEPDSFGPPDSNKTVEREERAFKL